VTRAVLTSGVMAPGHYPQVSKVTVTSVHAEACIELATMKCKLHSPMRFAKATSSGHPEPYVAGLRQKVHC